MAQDQNTDIRSSALQVAPAAVVSKATTAPVALAAAVVDITGIDIVAMPGDVLDIEYWLPIQVTGGVAGVKPLLTVLPAGTTGVRTIHGTTSSQGAINTNTDTTPDVVGATAFLTANFIGFLRVTMTLIVGAVGGIIRMGISGGAAQAGNVLTGARVRSVRVAGANT